MEYILTTERLTRKFGETIAVKDVSLHIRPGEIYGLIGRNGAGKTTILKMAAGMIRPTSGSVSFAGKSLDAALGDGDLTRIGSLIEAPGLYNGMTGHDNLRVKCLAAGIPYDPAYIHALLALVGIAPAEFRKAGQYSLGMRQRLGIALALIGEPELLILDEPINGLDPQGIAEVREILLRLHRERNITILISSHILGEMSKLVTTCGIIDKGVLLREFTREDMERETQNHAVIRTSDPEGARAALSAMGIQNMKLTDVGAVEVFEQTDRTEEMFRALARAEVPVRELFLCGQSLEDFFFSIVGGARDAQ